MTSPAEDFTRGWEYHQAGDLRRAEEAYRHALRADPRSARTWFALGDLCEADRRSVEAAACFRQAGELAPREAVAHYRLGNALLQQNHYAEAEAAYRRCLGAQPGHVEALVNLGFALGEQKRLDEAKVCYEQALALRPDLPEVYHNLGNVLREQGKMAEALARYREALRLKPDYAGAHVNLGIALAGQGEVDVAVRSLREGVRLQPSSAQAHTSLGAALCAQGRLEEALAQYETALRLEPDNPEAHWDRALVRLLQGDYERGWQEYEWRWRCPRPPPLPPFRQPRWDGSPLQGRTILLYAEQGLGDTFQFVRYAPRVRAGGGRVVLQCQDALLPLLSRTPGIDALVGHSASPPAFDVYVPLGSLPGLLGTTLSNIPAEVPYLFADPDLVAHWRRELAPVSGFRVGIAWQGSPQHPWDRHRSVPLSHFEPLARVPGIRLISLQQGSGMEQLTSLAGRFPVLTLGGLLDKTSGAFMDTAAVLHNLDLLVTVDTVLAHLAGGLGLPGWVALHHTPDWRWLLGRDNSPWYPTLRLFRQIRQGDWSDVFASLAAALQEAAARRRQARPLLVEVAAGDLLDRLTILEIKSERIRDPAKLRHVRAELEALAEPRRTLGESPELAALKAQLREVNERLWDVEDELRLCEQRQDFGPRFIELARSVYQSNDRRAALKRAVNELLHSPLVEEKSYADPGDPQ
jgi:tetratricopeptide (TPR) repeat protein